VKLAPRRESTSNRWLARWLERPRRHHGLALGERRDQQSTVRAPATPAQPKSRCVCWSPSDSVSSRSQPAALSERSPPPEVQQVAPAPSAAGPAACFPRATGQLPDAAGRAAGRGTRSGRRCDARLGERRAQQPLLFRSSRPSRRRRPPRPSLLDARSRTRGAAASVSTRPQSGSTRSCPRREPFPRRRWSLRTERPQASPATRRCRSPGAARPRTGCRRAGTAAGRGPERARPNPARGPVGRARRRSQRRGAVF
jgi:hypothetical protein